MTDQRLHPANARVAHESLRGTVDGVAFTQGISRSVAVPVLDLQVTADAARGSRDRQRLMGDLVNVLEDVDGRSFVVCPDGYVGYVDSTGLSDSVATTHFVSTMATHAFQDEDFKSTTRFHLPFGARLRVQAERQKFYETDVGYVPKKHLRPMDRPFEDPATIAQMHFGVPYLWGGNSTLGIDCSGLIQAALSACGINCPADSDMQCDDLGTALADDAKLQRGDLIFWKGHVGMMVDAETLIHANAHHMACRYEPFDQACLRIETQGDGPVQVRKRL
ncbi:NlpC/P60 family protein [Cognatiyoonia koreensis]|uniref:NlpC/P60 family protein n=1 Tax=Cognatiyoonia koreensis TaxID=364200 RepID=A0A1I0RFZ1_9RHOB|nr:NlpC/P60 family protein [Cognatiyoonia koreensis]SEW39178.1 NlpC/P60 family protein [Cognatiyoonia koreensis]